MARTKVDPPNGARKAQKAHPAPMIAPAKPKPTKVEDNKLKKVEKREIQPITKPDAGTRQVAPAKPMPTPNTPRRARKIEREKIYQIREQMEVEEKEKKEIKKENVKLAKSSNNVDKKKIKSQAGEGAKEALSDAKSKRRSQIREAKGKEPKPAKPMPTPKHRLSPKEVVTNMKLGINNMRQRNEEMRNS